MSHEHGTYLGSIRCLETLRERCVMDKDGDCWHLRTARGRPMQKGLIQRVFVFGHGHCTATRAAWVLAGRPLPTQKNMVIFRACEQYDCVNPAHLKAGTRRTLTRQMIDTKRFDTEARRAAQQKFFASRPMATKVTPELKVWLIESTQSGVEVAHGLGVTQGRANALRAEARKRPASVFNLGAGL
jgi:hypothetical protein